MINHSLISKTDAFGWQVEELEQIENKLEQMKLTIARLEKLQHHAEITKRQRNLIREVRKLRTQQLIEQQKSRIRVLKRMGASFEKSH
jgi:D-mannonate dehydratase